MPFDEANARDAGSDGAGGTYCNQATAGEGCNAWAANTNLVGQPSEFINGDYSGTVTQDSTLNTYLNGTYYTNVLGANINIIEGTYNVGNSNNESAFQWQGHVALLTSSEYKNGALDSSGTKYTNNNYLTKAGYAYWLLTPISNNLSKVRYIVGGFGGFSSYLASRTSFVRPVLYLSSNITLTGSGTNDANIFAIQ